MNPPITVEELAAKLGYGPGWVSYFKNAIMDWRPMLNSNLNPNLTMSEGGGEKEKTKEVNYIRYYFTDGSFITLNGVTFHSTSSTVDQIIIGDDQQFEIIRANMFYSQKQTTPFMD